MAHYLGEFEGRFEYVDPDELGVGHGVEVYLPGKSGADLSDDFRTWTYGAWEGETLSEYGMFNLVEHAGMCEMEPLD